MKKHPRTRGRPRTSTLTRAEQIRVAKRAQRRREREAGIAAVELRLPAHQAERLRAAATTVRFKEALEEFLQDVVLDINAWPRLRELAWNRADRWIPGEDALAVYERNWRFVEPAGLTKAEANLIDRLKDRYGRGVLNV
jgi:hypothetical protein